MLPPECSKAWFSYLSTPYPQHSSANCWRVTWYQIVSLVMLTHAMKNQGQIYNTPGAYMGSYLLQTISNLLMKKGVWIHRTRIYVWPCSLMFFHSLLLIRMPHGHISQITQNARTNVQVHNRPPQPQTLSSFFLLKSWSLYIYIYLLFQFWRPVTLPHVFLSNLLWDPVDVLFVPQDFRFHLVTLLVQHGPTLRDWLLEGISHEFVKESPFQPQMIGRTWQPIGERPKRVFR